MLDTPLTEAEFSRLDKFLMSDEAPTDTMDTSMLDGYLAAVASGPNLVMPNQMLRWVWDNRVLGTRRLLTYTVGMEWALERI